MKKLAVCDGLLDKDKEINAWKYCAPVFIASRFFGTALTKEQELVPKKFDKNSVRNGTLTFISYKGEYFALTCHHVLDALEKKQKAWKQQQFDMYGHAPAIEGFELFTSIGEIQHHFNYKLAAAPKNELGEQPDVALARVHHHYIKRLGREALLFTNKVNLPETGIASGYLEQQREILEDRALNSFCPKYVACTATLQVTAKGAILIQDSIDDHKDIDVLSGMSGGPIIWSDSKRFGFAGIVAQGLDILPKEGMLVEEPGIWIQGERITTEVFDKWMNAIPPLQELENQSKRLHTPEAMREQA